MRNQEKAFCAECRKETTYQIKRVPYRKLIRGKDIPLKFPKPYVIHVEKQLAYMD